MLINRTEHNAAEMGEVLAYAGGDKYARHRVIALLESSSVSLRMMPVTAEFGKHDLVFRV